MYLTAKQAAAELDVSIETLYAYVSRKKLRSVADGHSRERRYLADDVWALKQKKLHRGDPIQVAEQALHWGLPVLRSGVSDVRDGKLSYRGRDAIGLATQCTFEQVVALLWQGDLTATLIEPQPDEPDLDWKEVFRFTKSLMTLQAFQVVLPLAASRDAAAYDLRPHAVQRAGFRIQSLMTTVAARAKPNGQGIARRLQRAWGVSDDIVPVLQAALILYADNGLSPSTFTARCVASAGSTPYGVVLAGLAALQGSKHSGASERAEALLVEADTPAGAKRAVEARLRRGDEMPGFGHISYPDGDPRGALLMELAVRCRPKSSAVAIAHKVAAAVREMVNQEPNVDFGVVTLCRALDLPTSAPLTLLALGRTAGWIAHALEQYQEGRVIRPQARYAGDFY